TAIHFDTRSLTHSLLPPPSPADMLVFLLVLTVGLALAGDACSSLSCPFDSFCTPVIYHCSTAPCPPKMECVPRENSCLITRCEAGEQCVVKRKFCARMEHKILVLPQCAHSPTCVPEYPRCPRDEVYRECNGVDCEPTCAQNELCTSGCGTGGCVCEDGLVRHEGRCIPAENCPRPECPLFEVWESCPGKCAELTCANADNRMDTLACKRNGCGSPRCVCYPGYVRDTNNDCIPKLFCSQGSSITSQLKAVIEKDKVKITPASEFRQRV
ncbi:hypothetical protein PENTCL1PPCAC_1916, partial [Pristionchus entomophagus]